MLAQPCLCLSLTAIWAKIGLADCAASDGRFAACSTGIIRPGMSIIQNCPIIHPKNWTPLEHFLLSSIVLLSIFQTLLLSAALGAASPVLTPPPLTVGQYRAGWRERES